MPPKRDLSLEQIQEIRTLRGHLPAAEAKKRFGIGTTRLYRIWRDGSEAEAEAEGSPSPEQQDAVAEQRGGPLPTVADFYNRLGRIEARVEQVVRVLEEMPDELLATLRLSTQQEEIAEQVQEIRHEQAQKLEAAQKWVYISLAAVLAWKVAAATWRHTGVPGPKEKPSVLQSSSSSGTGPTPLPPATPGAKPGDPFYMA